MQLNSIIQGDALKVLQTFPDNSIDCCITSPPYYALRDYGMKGQIGLEETPETYIEQLTEVFDEIRRVLIKTGTLWLNIGDSYAGSGHGYLSEIKGKQATNKGSLFRANSPPANVPTGLKQKDLMGIPWTLAFSLRAAGWYLRQDIIWYKRNPMPESVKDRCTKAHEYIFLLTKSPKYYFNSKAIMEVAQYDGRKDMIMKGSEKYNQKIIPGKKEQSLAKDGHPRWQWENGIAMKNKRSVWPVPIKPFKDAHFATFPEKLIEPCVLAGCPENGIVLDPFFGAGTTGLVARKLNRNFIGIELNPAYIAIAEKRLNNELGLFK